MKNFFLLTTLLASLALLVPAWAQTPGTRCTRIYVEGAQPTPEQLRRYGVCKVTFAPKPLHHGVATAID